MKNATKARRPKSQRAGGVSAAKSGGAKRASSPRKAAAKVRSDKSPAVGKATARPWIAAFEPSLADPPESAKQAIRERSAKDVAGLAPEQLLEIYRYLYETRRLDQNIVALYRQNKVIGGVYTSLGQEGTAVGCAYAMRNGDFVQPLIRDVGATLVHGVTPLAFFRQYMARGTGPSAGRDLNSHFADPNVGIVGPVSMLGAMVPVICGCLLAARIKNERKAGLAFIGDGGSSTGAFYEGMGFAAVQKLPLVMVIEANRYAYSTPTSKQVPHGDLVTRARGFGCMVYHVDGNDVLACFEAARDARARAMQGLGPSIIVAETYRRKGHAEHDNQAYVPDGEIDDWAQHNDPLERFTAFLLKGKHAAASALEHIRNDVDQQMAHDRDIATAESFPEPHTLTWSVFADGNAAFPNTSTWFRGGPAHREK